MPDEKKKRQNIFINPFDKKGWKPLGLKDIIGKSGDAVKSPKQSKSKKEETEEPEEKPEETEEKQE